ncbi:MAG: fluoride efflux transporter CrcB [Gemmatimonadaceae bacterium]|nr:fluoride efflux transporter CrcB [Gemmatimonadaceae bacterium]
MSILLAVAIGSATGGVARYVLSGAIQSRQTAAFPSGTLVVNIVGSLILGALWKHAATNPQLSPELRVLLGAGFCGGFTTFSTFSVETLDLLQNGTPWRAASYVMLSITTGLLAATLGAKIAGRP